MPRKLTRRTFVAAGAATAVGVVGVSAWHLGRRDAETKLPVVPTRSPEELARDGERLAALLRPYAPGASVGGSELIRAFVDARGVGVVTLRTAGASVYRVEVCQREGEDMRPISATRHYALYLKNGGRGDLPTVEAQGLAVMALAVAIRANEGERAELELTARTALWAAAEA